MASASASADERAKQLPASVSGLAAPLLAASAAEAVDLSAGAAILALLLLVLPRLLLLLIRRVQASSLAQNAESRDYMQHVSISSYLPIVFLLLPFCFLVISRR